MTDPVEALAAALDDHYPTLVPDYGGDRIECHAKDCGAGTYDWWQVHGVALRASGFDVVPTGDAGPLEHAPDCDVFRIAESWEPYGEPRHCDCGFALWDAKRRGVYNWTPPTGDAVLDVREARAARDAEVRAAVEGLPEPTLGLKGGVSRAAVLAILDADTPS